MWLFMWYEIFCALSCRNHRLGSNQISLWNEACLDTSMKGWSRCISPRSISDYSACGCAFHSRRKNLHLLCCRADVLRSCMDNRFRHGHVHEHEHEKLGQVCDVSVWCRTLGHTTEGCWICQQMGVKYRAWFIVFTMLFAISWEKTWKNFFILTTNSVV